MNYETFLNGVFRKKRHLKALMWNINQPLRRLEPLSRKPNIELSTKLESLDVTRAMYARFRYDSLFLLFDSGLRRMVESIPFLLKDRNIKKEPERRKKTVWRKCYRFGWAGQYAYTQYLNFYAPRSKFTYRFDNVFGSGINLQADVHVKFPNEQFWIEIKTALPKRKTVRYYINPYYPYPKYVICVQALSEDLTKFEVVGYCHGSDVEAIKPLNLKGSSCHEIPITRSYWTPYRFFHENILKLPFEELFNDEHRDR